MGKTSVKAAVIAVVIVTIVGLGFGVPYNDLNSSKNDVDAQWSQVENVMQRRMDLIPNLVNTVKGSMKHEDKIFDDIAKSRQQYANATTNNDKLSADQKTNSNLSTLVTAINENYPNLSSNDNVKTLMVQLEGSENRISVERERYIQDVNTYNKKVTSFPANLTAGALGFKKMANYQAETGASVTPKVDLGE